MPLFVNQYNWFDLNLRPDVVDGLMLQQHVSTPTLIRIGRNVSLLGLIPTNFPDTPSDVWVLTPLSKNYHVLRHLKVGIRDKPSAHAAPPLFKFSALEADVVR